MLYSRKPVSAFFSVNEFKREIVFRRLTGRRQLVHIELMQVRARRQSAMHGEDYLKEWIAVELSLRLQLFDEFVEWQVLMLVSTERDFSDALQELTKCELAGDLRAQHQDVEEETDQVFGFAVMSISDRGADYDVVLLRVPVQQHLESGEQSHEQRCAFTVAQTFDSIAQRLWKREIESCAVESRVRRSRPIAWQL